eukprot:COSAG06_NODE_1011_length_11045_cov_6.246723_3_plen_164_part_00
MIYYLYSIAKPSTASCTHMHRVGVGLWGCHRGRANTMWRFSCACVIMLFYHHNDICIIIIIIHYTILYYVILYYTILYYTILYYTILYYTISPMRACVCAVVPCAHVRCCVAGGHDRKPPDNQVVTRRHKNRATIKTGRPHGGSVKRVVATGTEDTCTCKANE